MDPYTKEKIALADALENAVVLLRSEAKRLKLIAEAHRKSAANWERLNRHVSTAPHLVEWLKACGSNDPITQAAEMLDTTPEFVESHYGHFTKAQAGRERRQRNREIVRLARRGHTNRHIAARMDVSVSTVKRVLKQADLGRYAKGRCP